MKFPVRINMCIPIFIFWDIQNRVYEMRSFRSLWIFFCIWASFQCLDRISCKNTHKMLIVSAEAYWEKLSKWYNNKSFIYVIVIFAFYYEKWNILISFIIWDTISSIITFWHQNRVFSILLVLHDLLRTSLVVKRL